MREETRRRLDAELARRRWLKIGAAAAVLAAVGLAFLAADWRQRVAATDELVREAKLGGTVEQWHFVANKQAAGRAVITVRVHLDDGRTVDAGSTAHHEVRVGSHIDITERHYKSGRVAHVWE